MSSGDLLELRMALELALQFEFGDFEIDGGITVADLIEAIIGRSKAA
jgi:acyl carrier protein